VQVESQNLGEVLAGEEPRQKSLVYEHSVGLVLDVDFLVLVQLECAMLRHDVHVLDLFDVFVVLQFLVQPLQVAH